MHVDMHPEVMMVHGEKGWPEFIKSGFSDQLRIEEEREDERRVECRL